ncbi:RNA-binding snoRNP assembly protein [Saccharomycopsis crataegensis]|uniref:H/ACA ribonucleoprotein complex non-core subunit NAF1 n=1 Tax=Saccharomycopsis crataegensis TaxID=43959 RepID=A0AAV5QII2_9ASCO|nr:RNA-binding snoRNP assembly protein [Saccharomycopsis crataegensis]
MIEKENMSTDIPEVSKKIEVSDEVVNMSEENEESKMQDQKTTMTSTESIPQENKDEELKNESSEQGNEGILQDSANEFLSNNESKEKVEVKGDMNEGDNSRVLEHSESKPEDITMNTEKNLYDVISEKVTLSQGNKPQELDEVLKSDIHNPEVEKGQSNQDHDLEKKTEEDQAAQDQNIEEKTEKDQVDQDQNIEEKIEKNQEDQNENIEEKVKQDANIESSTDKPQNVKNINDEEKIESLKQNRKKEIDTAIQKLNIEPADIDKYSSDEVDANEDDVSESDSDSSDNDISGSGSESDSESDSDDEEGHEDDDLKSVENLEFEDDENLDGPIKSKNELPEEAASSLPEDFKIDEKTPIELIGEVHAFSENNLIVKGNNSAEYRVLKENSVLCFEDRTPVGLIFEIFGPLRAPFYRIKFNTDNEKNHESFKDLKGTKVYYVVTNAEFELTEKIKAFKGCDASNGNDEELAQEELEFSDDAAEANFKKAKKNKKKRKQDSASKDGAPPPKKFSGSSKVISYTPISAADDDDNNKDNMGVRPYSISHPRSNSKPSESELGLPPVPSYNNNNRRTQNQHNRQQNNKDTNTNNNQGAPASYDAFDALRTNGGKTFVQQNRQSYGRAPQQHQQNFPGNNNQQYNQPNNQMQVPQFYAQGLVPQYVSNNQTQAGSYGAPDKFNSQGNGPQSFTNPQFSASTGINANNSNNYNHNPNNNNFNNANYNANNYNANSSYNNNNGYNHNNFNHNNFKNNNSYNNNNSNYNNNYNNGYNGNYNNNYNNNYSNSNYNNNNYGNDNYGNSNYNNNMPPTNHWSQQPNHQAPQFNNPSQQATGPSIQSQLIAELTKNPQVAQMVQQALEAKQNGGNMQNHDEYDPARGL